MLSARCQISMTHSTLTHPGPVALETFRDDIQRICGAFDVAAKKRCETIHAQAGLSRFGAVDLARIALTDAHVKRNRACIRRDPGDHFFLVIQEQGQALMAQDETTCLLSPGDMFLVDSTQPSEFIYDGDASLQTSLHLPRDEMQRRFGERVSGGMDIRHDDALGLALRSVIARMLQHENRNLAHFGETVFSILGCILIERERGNRPTVQSKSATLTAALQQIASHYKNPDFGPAELAAQLNLSPRTIQREFRMIGETPRQRLLRVRLANARNMLEKVQAPIATVAYDCGFNDLSYFYREYRKQYGEAPGALVTRGRDPDVSVQ